MTSIKKILAFVILFGFSAQLMAKAGRPISDFWACAEGKWKPEDMPNVDITTLSVPMEDLSKKKSSRFLYLLATRTKGLLEQNRILHSIYEQCLESEKESILINTEDDPEPVKVSCQLARTDFSELRNLIKIARFELALSSAYYYRYIFSKKIRYNFTLNSGLREKVIKWAPLTENEQKSVEEVWNDLISQVVKNQPKTKKNISDVSARGLQKEPTDLFFLDEIATQKKLHLANYDLIIANWPIIQYLKSDSFSQEDLMSAISQLKENLKKVEYENDLSLASLKHDKLVATNLYLMEMPALVEETLTLAPQYCAIAQTLNKYREIRSEQYAAISILSSIFSIFSRPLMYLTMSSNAAISFYYSWDNLNWVKEKALISVRGQSAIQEVSDIRRADRDLKANVAGTAAMVVLPPLFFAGTRWAALKSNGFINQSLEKLEKTIQSKAKAQATILKSVLKI